VTFSATKDPDANLDYGFDWSQWLAASETISTSIWIVDAGLTKGTTSATTTGTTVWLSGGTAGTTYLAVNRIVTNQGRTDDRTVKVFVVNR
jgi:hypothetical protein